MDKGIEKEQRFFVTLYLKYGHIISFTCTNFMARQNVFSKYTEVKWEGIDRTLSFSIDDLIAFTTEPVKENE